jgi:hypothetical protein
MHHVVTAIPEAREAFWRTFMNCAKTNPPATRIVVSLMMLYLHLGPFSRRVIAGIDRRLAALEHESPVAGHLPMAAAQPAHSPSAMA